MVRSASRRSFLGSASYSAGSIVFAGPGLIPGLPELARDDVTLSQVVPVRPEIEPVVRLLEDTPRSQVIESVARRIRDGRLSYRELLAALMLAGVRNVEPYPSVGFKFHAVLVVNSAHMASLSSPDSDRWLPILWAVDSFKSSQDRDVQERNWTMRPVRESAVPPAELGRDAFHEAMQMWDAERADAATACVARTLGAVEILELFAQYAARDFRAIGHKVIYLANAWRTLQTIGWEHAEPILRSLAYAMLNHNGEPNPGTADLVPDRSWRLASELAAGIRPGWESGRQEAASTTALLSVLRTGSWDDAARSAAQMLNDGIAPQAICDALHLGAGELLMRQPGIVALHAVTTTNAVRFLFDQVHNPTTRLQLLLQNVAFLPQFREAMAGRGALGDASILTLMQPAESGSPHPLDEIFSNVRGRPATAARQVWENLEARGEDAGTLMNAARRLIFLKGTDSHDYKFSSAALEDYYKVSPHFRNGFLASSVYHLRGSGDPDNTLIDRIRAALAG